MIKLSMLNQNIDYFIIKTLKIPQVQHLSHIWPKARKPNIVPVLKGIRPVSSGLDLKPGGPNPRRLGMAW